MRAFRVCRLGNSFLLQRPFLPPRRFYGALSRLLQDRNDPYLQAVQELDLPRISTVARTGGESPRHLWDGLAATNAVLRMQVEGATDGVGATEAERDAAYAVYAEVMRRDMQSAVSPQEWREEWETALEEFRVIFRATGDKRVP